MGCAPAVQAAGVPEHLVAMAVDVLDSTRQELKQGVGDVEHKELCRRAYKIVRQRGLLHWARGDFAQKDVLEGLEEVLGFEKTGTGHLKPMQVLLDTLREAGTREAIKACYASAGKKAPEGDRLVELAEKVEGILVDSRKDLDTEYTIEGLQEGERIRLKWTPDTHGFDIHILDQGGEDREPFKVTLAGDVNKEVSPDGKSISYSAEPAGEPIRVRNAAEIKEETRRSFEAVTGDWIDQDGDRWVIESSAGKPGPDFRSLRLVHYEAGAVLDWEGRFEFGQIKAKRKATHLLDTKEELPMEVRKQIIGKWQPMLNLELEPIHGKEDGVTMLKGLHWSWHVTYGGSDYTVKRIHSAYSRPLILTREVRIVSIRFVESDPPYGTLEVVQTGDDFRVRVVFERDPGIDSESVTLKSPVTGDEIIVSAKRTARPPVFMTDPVRFESPEKGKGLCPCERQ